MAKNITIVLSKNNTPVLVCNQNLFLNLGMKLSERVKAARNYAELSQEELALAVGCTQGLISKIERGDQEETALIVKIARACNVNADWLEDETGPMEKNFYPAPDSIEQKVLAVMQPMSDYQKVQYLRIGNTLAEPSQEPNGKHSSQ